MDTYNFDLNASNDANSLSVPDGRIIFRFAPTNNFPGQTWRETLRTNKDGKTSIRLKKASQSRTERSDNYGWKKKSA
jgi:hypothetical protein